MSYLLQVGLETHLELKTKSKIFCSCENSFSSLPNTHCCPVCLGHPGTLPTLNGEAVRLAVMAGLALNCKIQKNSIMDRKNYFYPDLPKAYQISQFDVPLCRDGFLTLSSGKIIRIERIHIEEDAGKLIHKDGKVYIDYNRVGVPLIEIVTHPDIESVDEAREYVQKLQRLMRYLGISDCKMQEGSMRCDVNVSVRKEPTEPLGTRTEIKNMNSVSYMTRAIEYEYKRQSELLEKGGRVKRETLRFIESDGSTQPMRSKENADDYRFLPEPDLLSLTLTHDEIEAIKAKIPELPDEKIKRYTECFGLSPEDSENLIKYPAVANYFEKAAQIFGRPKMLSNFICGQIFAFLKTEEEKESFDIPVTPENLCELLSLLEQKKISNALAKETLGKMLQSGKSCGAFLSEEDFSVLDENTLKSFCREALEENQKALADYKDGKEKALKAILGAVMKKSKGKAQAEKALKIIKEIIG